MKGSLLLIVVLGAVVNSQAGRVAVKNNRGLTGNECKGHPHGDQIPYPGDCTKFLVCEYFDGTVVQCPSGLHFNPVLKVCDWPTSAGCEGGGGSTGNECKGHPHGDQIPYPGDCTKFLVCEYFGGTVMQCPSGLHFNPVLKVCDWPTSAGCEGGGQPPTQPPTDPPTQPPTEPPTQPPTDPPTQPPTQPPTEPPTDPPTQPPTQPPTEPPTQPPTEPPTEPPTQPPTEPPTQPPTQPPTDPPTQPPTEPPTEPPTQPPTQPPTEPPTQPPTEPPTQPPTEPPTQPPTQPPTEPPTQPPTQPPTEPSTEDPIPTVGPGHDFCSGLHNNTILPYPWDCKWYIRCEDNIALIEPCEEGRIFNSELLICDFPENTECKEEPYPPTAPPTDSTTFTTTEEPCTSTPNPPYIGTGICENIERGTLLPYPGRCDLYIKCIEPAPTTFSCPKGQEFNAKLKICQDPQDAGCSIPEVTPSSIPATTEYIPSPQPIPSGICSTHPYGDLIPYPGNCSQYISCVSPIPIAQECPKGLEFNAELKLCDSPQDAGCSGSPVEPPLTPEPPTTIPPPPDGSSHKVCKDHENGELVPYPGDCTKFIVCQEPIPTAGKCDKGLIFNADLGICDAPVDDSCVVPTLPPPTECPSDPALTGLCKGHQIGDLVQYPGSCTKYIRCLIPVPVAETCKNDLLFNEALGICDTDGSAECSGSTPSPEPTPSPPGSNSTTGICEGHKPGDLLPYPGQCSKFIECGIPVSYGRTCQHGYHFNANLSICDDPAAAQCEPVLPPTTTELPPSGSNVCCGAQNGTFVAYPEDCSQYIQCIYPIPVALQCRDGRHYNEVSQKCEPVNMAGCQWYEPITCKGKEDGTVFPYKDDCKKYYFCSSEELVLLPCTIGAVFDKNVGKCVPGTVCP